MSPDPTFWSGRPVCVTGGTGFLGLHLIRSLRSHGAQVRVFALEPPASHPIRAIDGLDLVWGNIGDPAAVAGAVAGCSVVFHAAGLVAVWGPALKEMWAVHVDGTTNVLNAVSPGTRVVHTSSVVAIGGSRGGRVLTEDSPFELAGTRIDYVLAKRAAEEIALKAAKAGQEVVVVNPGYLVGPEDYDGSVMGRLCHRYWRGRAPIAPPGGLNLVDVRDVAVGHLLAAERGTAGRRYILGGENHGYSSFLRLLAAAAGFRPRWQPRLPWTIFAAMALGGELRGWLRGREPYPSLGHARLNWYSWFASSERAREELGFVPRPLAVSLAETYAWYAGRERFNVRGFNQWLMRPGKGVRSAI